MIRINFFTSGKHTQPIIEALRQAKNIELLGIHKKLPRSKSLPRGVAAAGGRLPGGGTIADIFLVADFGQIIPPKIFKIPKYGSLCIHPSLLPKYRGASPAAYAIMNGEKQTGVTVFELDKKIDHGPIISQIKEPIQANDTQESLLSRLFQKGGDALTDILPDYVKGRVQPKTQDHSQATYAPRLKKEDGRIDWKKSDPEIERFIRAMYPWPSAWTSIVAKGSKVTPPRWPAGTPRRCDEASEKRLKILKAHLSTPDRLLKPIMDRENLVIDEVQLEGKKPITWQQFQVGYPDFDFS